MKKILFYALIAFSNFSYGCEVDLVKSQEILNWLIKAKEAEVLRPIKSVKLPTIKWYSKLSVKEKSFCKECLSFPEKAQMNMFIKETNEIWLIDDAREDQLVHELRHTLQFAEDPDVEGTEDWLEDDAVYWQNMYVEKFGRVKLCDN